MGRKRKKPVTTNDLLVLGPGLGESFQRAIDVCGQTKQKGKKKPNWLSVELIEKQGAQTSKQNQVRESVDVNAPVVVVILIRHIVCVILALSVSYLILLVGLCLEQCDEMRAQLSQLHRVQSAEIDELASLKAQCVIHKGKGQNERRHKKKDGEHKTNKP